MSDEKKLEKKGAYADEITADIAYELVEESFADEESRAACLLFLTGPMMGHYIPLEEQAREVGRADDADIIIKDQGVSRRHACFYLRQNRIGDPDGFVEDLGSSNGVYVNGERIDGAKQLYQGDKITLGTETVLRFTFQDEVDQAFQKRLLDAAINDGLTGMRNRAYFDQKIRAEFDYAARYHTKLSLIIFDIDYFKQVNDTYGHVAGDAVLVHLGACMLDAVREEDFLARYGGEEFAMICRELSAEQGFKAAERLRKIVDAEVFKYGDIEIELTVSAGVVSYPELSAKTHGELIAAADEALYRAKSVGRNRTLLAQAHQPGAERAKNVGE